MRRRQELLTRIPQEPDEAVVQSLKRELRAVSKEAQRLAALLVDTEESEEIHVALDAASGYSIDS